MSTASTIPNFNDAGSAMIARMKADNPLYTAMWGEHLTDEAAVPEVLQLIADKHDVNKLCVAAEATPLMVAAKLNFVKCGRLLMQNGAKPYFRNSHHRNALDFCTHEKRLRREEPSLEFAMMLVQDFKTDPRVKDTAGITAAMIARQNEHHELAAYLAAQEKRFKGPLPYQGR